MTTNAKFAIISLGGIVLLLLELFSILATDEKVLLIVNIVLAILLLIALVIIAYLVCEIKSSRVKSPTTKVKQETKNNESNPKPHIYDTPDPSDPYQNSENELATYTDLKVPGQRDDDHMYAHLQPHIYANTAI